MIFNMNANDIVSGIYSIVNADTTLQGSGYLDGTGKVFVQRVPVNPTPPYLLITLSSIIPNAMQIYTGELRIFCYTALQLNGQINTIGDLILNRCDELLNDQQFTIESSGAGLPDVQTQPLYSLGIIPSFFDSSGDDTLARGVCRYRLEFGYKSL